MTQQEKLRALSGRLTAVRASLLTEYPFFGRLLLHLRFGFAACGTAFTDAKRIVFDPAFAEKLDDEALKFVLLHEVMHCVLHHCTRGLTLQPFLYNVACDIVVNSLILETMGLPEMCICGENVMHLVPDGSEGRRYSAEAVYDMLLHASPQALAAYSGGGPDTHVVWQQIDDVLVEDAWNEHVKEAAGRYGAGIGSGIPRALERYLREINHTPKTNWRQLLHDFIRNDRSDYVYTRPDTRFQGDVIMPSFQENVYGEKVERLWFLIDTSGSISVDALAEAFGEVCGAMEQIGNLTGALSFFDTQVTPPQPFASTQELFECRPVGGGGTSFYAIFDAMHDHYEENDLPAAIIILTDGRAVFPEEDAACGCPVLWIVIDSDVEPPWGVCVHIESGEEG